MRSPILAGFLILASCAAADEFDDRMQAFREALAPHLSAIGTEKPAPDARPDLETQKRQQREMIVRAMAGLASQTDAGTLARQLEELRRYAETPAELKTLLDALARDLPKLAGQRAERRVAEIDRMVEKVAPACLAARTEADLDPLLRELSRVTVSTRGEMPGGELEQRATRRLQAAVQTVSTWQDYLAHLALGRTAGATAALQRLLEDSSYPIIARPEIERRLIAPAPAREEVDEDLAIITRVERIEDLATAVAEMRRKRAPASDPAGKSVVQALEQIVAHDASFQAGFYAQAFRNATGMAGGTVYSIPPAWAAQVTRLRGLLLVKVLPRYLELRDLPPAKTGETGSDYLLRLLEDFVQHRRFADAIRVLETYRSVAFDFTTPEPAWITADTDGLRAFAAAERFASVELWAEAINYFRRAAETAGRFTPSKEAAERLAALSKAHPEEAQAAARLAEAEATYERMSRDAASRAARSVESRLPPDLRDRMQRSRSGFPP